MIPGTVRLIPLTVSRSLILCHSKTNDDPGPEEVHAGEASEGRKTWSLGGRTDMVPRDQTGYRDAENGHWGNQQSMEKGGGREAGNQRHHITTISENKKSTRRSFCIKVRLQAVIRVGVFTICNFALISLF